VTPAQPEPAADWFFVMTVQVVMPGGGYAVETTNGIIPLSASSSRGGAFRKIMSACRERDWVPGEAVVSVLFFYLEPDRPTAPAQAPEVTS
jgi:hypothetical protein